MKKKILIGIAIGAIVLAVISVIAIVYGKQYNIKGVSHCLIVTHDESQHKQFVGSLDNEKVYIEGFILDEVYFITVDAKHLSIEDAMKQNKVSVEEWKENAISTQKSGDTTIYKYEDYEIAITGEEVLIRPLSQ